jgi:hypothetical protein
VRGLLGDAVEELRCEPRTFAMVFDGTRESLYELYRDCFGPVLRLRAALVDQPAQVFPAANSRDPLLDLGQSQHGDVQPVRRRARDPVGYTRRWLALAGL